MNLRYTERMSSAGDTTEEPPIFSASQGLRHAHALRMNPFLEIYEPIAHDMVMADMADVQRAFESTMRVALKRASYQISDSASIDYNPLYQHPFGMRDALVVVKHEYFRRHPTDAQDMGVHPPLAVESEASLAKIADILKLPHQATTPTSTFAAGEEAETGGTLDLATRDKGPQKS